MFADLGIVREQLKHAVIDDPPTFPAAGSGSSGYGGRSQLPPPFTTGKILSFSSIYLH